MGPESWALQIADQLIEQFDLKVNRIEFAYAITQAVEDVEDEAE